MHSPIYSPTERHGEVLVVFEGRRRLAWSGPDNGLATVSSLWPNTAQRGTVDRHLSQHAPLLVVIDHDTSPVQLLPEEVPALPPGVLRLLDDNGGFPVLRIPLLDWLPEPLRRRGTAFMAAVEAQRGSIPRPLLPDLVPDQDTDQPVRFARRTTERSISSFHLGEAIRHLFGECPARQACQATPFGVPAPAPVPVAREPITTGPTT